MFINLDSSNDGMFSQLAPSDTAPCLPCEFEQLIHPDLKMQVTSDEQEENIISAKMEEDCLWNSILSKCEEIDSFQLQNISGLEEINEFIDDIKLEPSLYVPFSVSPSSFNDSESIGSDWQLETPECMMQSLDPKFFLNTPPTSPPLSSPSPPSPLNVSNITQQVKLISVNESGLNIDTIKKHTKHTLHKTDSVKPIYIKSADAEHCIKDDKLQNTITLRTQDCAALTHGVNSRHQELYTSNMQSSTSRNVNILNLLNIGATNARTETTAFQLPQSVNVINTLPNVFSKGSAKSVVNTPVILQDKPMPCDDVVKSEPMSCTPFIVTNSTSCAPLIIKTEPDLVSLPGNRQESELKALKRQQRMIKNRESACLSRKKKKEYISSLEKQISDLIEANKQLKLENETLKQKLRKEESIVERSIVRKYGNFNVKKKNIGIFLAVVGVLSINLSGLWGISIHNTYRKSTSISNKASISVISDIDQIRQGRTLLWTVDENNNNHIDDRIDGFNKNLPLRQPVCPNINQSESIRLDSELRRWIDGESDQDNWTALTKTKPRTDPLNALLPPSSSSFEKKTKSEKGSYLPHGKTIKAMHKVIDDVPAAALSNNNAVQVFSPILSEHASLFEALGRKDDTFYVVWFSGEHLLLPASQTNDTARPKMSLVLPAVSINGTFSTPPNHITMMQIDCEVTNTQLLHLQQSVIPVRLRSGKSTSHSNRSHPVKDVANSSTVNIRNVRSYKPYFMREAGQKPLYAKNFKGVYEHKNVKDFRNKNTIYVYKENLYS